MVFEFAIVDVMYRREHKKGKRDGVRLVITDRPPFSSESSMVYPKGVQRERERERKRER